MPIKGTVFFHALQLELSGAGLSLGGGLAVAADSLAGMRSFVCRGSAQFPVGFGVVPGHFGDEGLQGVVAACSHIRVCLNECALTQEAGAWGVPEARREHRFWCRFPVGEAPRFARSLAFVDGSRCARHWNRFPQIKESSYEVTLSSRF